MDLESGASCAGSVDSSCVSHPASSTETTPPKSAPPAVIPPSLPAPAQAPSLLHSAEMMPAGGSPAQRSIGGLSGRQAEPGMQQCWPSTESGPGSCDAEGDVSWRPDPQTAGGAGSNAACGARCACRLGWILWGAFVSRERARTSLMHGFGLLLLLLLLMVFSSAPGV